MFQQELFRQTDFDIPPGIPFEKEVALNIPAGAMHSFKSGHNHINWTLLVESDISGWPAFKRAFPVIIYPNAGADKA